MSTTELMLRIVVPILGGVVIASILMFIGCPWAPLVSHTVLVLTFGINMAVEAIRAYRTRSN